MEKKNDLLSFVEPMGDFMRTDFIPEQEKGAPLRISTGFKELDVLLSGGLSSELYVLSAETSIGKTVFALNIAQNIAEQGTDVLYFSLEMSKRKMAARGISMISCEAHETDENKEAFSVGAILKWQYDDATGEFKRAEYKDYADYTEEYIRRYGEHLHVVETKCNGWSAREIDEAARAFKKQTGKPVVVVVDYLQAIQPDRKDPMQRDRKTKTDIVGWTLKTLAEKGGMPVIAISSVGRSSYGASVGIGSSKESGDTEYTAEVMLGLNWTGYTDEKEAAKRKAKSDECDRQGFRKMRLDFLKQRDGRRGNGIDFKYYHKYNRFVVWTDAAGEGRTEKINNKKIHL